jgi:thioredoxin-related protein
VDARSFHLTSDRRRALLALIAATMICLAPAGDGRAQSLRDSHEPLTRIDDLRALSAQARKQQRPVLLFFSVPGCPFCLEVRRSHLVPRLQEADRGPLIREIEISSRRTFIASDGTATTEYDFANRYKVRMVPHVVLVDADLKLLGDPMIGIGVSDFYGAYLNDAIDNATRKLRGK